MLAATITLVGASMVEPQQLLNSSVEVYFSNIVKRSDLFQGFLFIAWKNRQQPDSHDWVKGAKVP